MLLVLFIQLCPHTTCRYTLHAQCTFFNCLCIVHAMILNQVPTWSNVPNPTIHRHNVNFHFPWNTQYGRLHSSLVCSKFCEIIILLLLICREAQCYYCTDAEALYTLHISVKAPHRLVSGCEQVAAVSLPVV